MVGAGRITSISNQLYFGAKVGYTDRYPVWSRCISHAYPDEGFRLPYQEYLRGDHDVAGILCYVSPGSTLDFSYVGEHVSDDVAVGILERLLQSVEAVIAENIIEGKWVDQLKWLNDVLSEVWSNRGPYPGIGSVLRFLEMPRGTLFQRTALVPRSKKGENPWEYVHAILDGNIEPAEGEYKEELKAAAARWKAYPASRRRLLQLLTRFELSSDQVARIAKPEKRQACGIEATDEEVCANPYLISEEDQGDANSEPVALETIDRGMRPEGDAALFIGAKDQVPQDDPRRVRASACAVLSESADMGDTLLPFGETLRLIGSRFPDRRACSPDSDLVIAQADFYREALQFLPDNDPPLIALKQLATLEEEVRKSLTRRVMKVNEKPPKDFDWNPFLDEAVGSGKGTKLDRHAEKRARIEKISALSTLVERRFSVLTGGAGTGKTSVLAALLSGLRDLQGRTSALLLAPTGKARVRLSTKTGRNASTIHQFLLKQEWLRRGTFSLKYSGGTAAGATTVIVDEASMIPMDLFGILLRALDLNQVRLLAARGRNGVFQAAFHG